MAVNGSQYTVVCRLWYFVESQKRMWIAKRLGCCQTCNDSLQISGVRPVDYMYTGTASDPLNIVLLLPLQFVRNNLNRRRN